jgi:hypothetical protein
MAVFRIKESFCERPIMAVPGLPAIACERQLTGKQTLKSSIQAAETDPQRPPKHSLQSYKI